MSEIWVRLAGYGFMGHARTNAYRCQAVPDAVERGLEGRDWTGPDVLGPKEV